jgi:nanoRNase/pAp phosphatase (c-di-AMP/oligoRNAs hydrolase)
VSESLLAGIVSATESFQKKNTTPKALHIASLLMERGADQQKIVRSLYKTQPLHLLKLWGRVMAGVKWNESLRLIWALVGLEDLVQARSRSEDLPQVLEKIRTNYSTAALFLILYPESNALVRGLMKAAVPENLTPLLDRFGDGEMQGDTFSFTVPARTLEEAEQLVIAKLQTAAPQLPS